VEGKCISFMLHLELLTYILIYCHEFAIMASFAEMLVEIVPW
jgi:hypothetical protein